MQSQQVPASTADVAGPAANVILDKAVSEREQIALLAYQFWQERGGQWGSAEEDWYRAEQELRKRRKSDPSRC